MALAITVFRTALSILKTLSYRNPSNMRELPPCVIGCLQEIFFFLCYGEVSPFSAGTSGKEPPCQCRRQKRRAPSLGQEDLEEGVATHSSLLAWRVPWAEEPGGLQSTALQSQTRLRTRQEGPASLPLRHSSPEGSTKVY